MLKGGSIGADNIAAKIIEFSKNIRELNAELGKEKTKSQNYKRQIDFLEHQQVSWIQLTRNAKTSLFQLFEVVSTSKQLCCNVKCWLELL